MTLPLTPPICRRCDVPMPAGIAMLQTYTGDAPELGGEVMTLSAGGPGRVIGCCSVSGVAGNARQRHSSRDRREESALPGLVGRVESAPEAQGWWMDDYEKFSFVIPAYSPETMPLDRLIEYLQQIAAIIGEPENLHLIEIEQGSTAPTFLVPRRTALVARDRAAQVERGEGTKEQTRAYNRIRRMLRRDASSAARPARLMAPGKTILEIPAAPDDSGILTGVRQATTVDGSLIRIGGAGENAALQMQDLQGRVISGFTVNKHLAKEMARLIYEPIRVSGIGLWDRTSDGIWELDRMQVQSFETLEDEPLSVTLERMRNLHVVWPDDASERLAAEREAGL